MPELRWALIGLGVLFLIGLVLWERRRSRQQMDHASQDHAGTTPREFQHSPDPLPRARRIEPGFDELTVVRNTDRDDFDVPTIHPMESVPVASESAVDVPAALRSPAVAEPAAVPLHGPEPDAEPGESAPDLPHATQSPENNVAIRWPPEHAGRVLSLRVVNPLGEALSGRQVRNALESAGFLPGPQTIYHRIDAEGNVLVSVANLVRPGNLDPALMDAQHFKGLNLFSVLPGAMPAGRMLDELLAVARLLAHRLGAAVQNDQGLELDAARLASLRQSLPEESTGAGSAP